MPGCVVYQLQRKYGNGGWGETMKEHKMGRKMMNFLRIAFFDVDLVGLRKNGWILAIRRKSKAKRPHLPENKEKGSRKSLCVCLACSGCDAWPHGLPGAIPAVPLPLPRNGSFLAGALGSPLSLLKKPLFSAYWMQSSSPASDHLPRSVLPILISKSVRP